MGYSDTNSKIRMIIFCILIVSVISTAFSISTQSVSIIEDDKKNVSNTILSASLGFTGLLLTVLAYAFSRISSSSYPSEKEPFQFLANITYYIILISITEASFSIAYLITHNNIWFSFLIIFLYILFISLFIITGYWIEKELSRYV